MKPKKSTEDMACDYEEYSGCQQKQKDDAAIQLINGLNHLIRDAKATQLDTAARILLSAKEELVY